MGMQPWEEEMLDAQRSHDRLDRVIEVLNSLRREHHYECGDGWYSCPKAGNYIRHNDSDDELKCTCIVDELNEEIAATIEKMRGLKWAT
jgi:hypothetical protein